MRIRLLANIGTRECDIEPPLLEGQDRDVHETFGQSLVKRHLAVDLSDAYETFDRGRLQAIPESPAIAEAKRPEIAEQEPEVRRQRSPVLPVKPHKNKEP